MLILYYYKHLILSFKLIVLVRWSCIMSVTGGLKMCNWTSCSSPSGFHVPSPFAQCALARKEGLGGLAPGRRVCGSLRSTKRSREVWGPQDPQFNTSPNSKPKSYSSYFFRRLYEKRFPSVCLHGLLAGTIAVLFLEVDWL